MMASAFTQEYIEDSSIPEPNSGCWLWLRDINYHRYGYGQARLGRLRSTAQRASYIAFKGPIAAKLDVDHLCHNPACVNPAHLEAVTHKVNCLRRSGRLTTCKNGHPFDGLNAQGHRKCQICRNDNNRRYYQRQRTPAGRAALTAAKGGGNE